MRESGCASDASFALSVQRGESPGKPVRIRSHGEIAKRMSAVRCDCSGAPR